MPRRVRRSLLRGRAVRSLPLAPNSVLLIPSCQCAAFIEKSELTTGGSLPLPFLPPIPIRTLIPNPLLDPLAPRSDHVLDKPGLGICSPLDDDSPGPARRVYSPPES